MIIIAAVVRSSVLPRNTFIIANSTVPPVPWKRRSWQGDRIIGPGWPIPAIPSGEISLFSIMRQIRNEETRLVKGHRSRLERRWRSGQSAVHWRNPRTKPYLVGGDESDDYHFEVPEAVTHCWETTELSQTRYWPDPCVPEKKILAKVLFRYYPRIEKSNTLESLWPSRSYWKVYFMYRIEHC